MRGSFLLCIFLIIFNQLGNHLLYAARDHIVGNAVDGRLGVGVDRDDDARVLHTSDMLDLSRDTTGDIDLRMDGDTRLSDLAVVIDPARVHGRAACADLSMQEVGQLKEQVEVFL